MSERRPVGERIVRAGLAVGVAHVIFKIAGFAQSWIVGRHLDNATFDVVYGFAFEGVVFTLFLIGEEVIGPAFLPVFMKERDEGREDAAWSFANTVLTVQSLVLLSTILVLVVNPMAAVSSVTDWAPDDPKYAVGARAVRLLAPALFCFSLGSTTYMLLNGHKRFFIAAFGDATWKFAIFVSVAIGIGVMGLGFEAMIFGLVVGSLAKLLTHLIGLRDKLGRFRFRLDLKSDSARAMMLLMLPLIVGILLGKVRDVFNNVTVLSSIAEDGLIKANLFGRKIFVAIGWMVPYALSIAMFPFFCEMVDRDDRKEFGRVLSHACRALLSVIVPLALVCVVLADPISYFLFLGGKFDPQTVGWIALSMACYTLVLPGYAVEYFFMQAFFAERRMVAVTVVGIVFSMLSIAISATAIYGFDLAGAHALAAVALGYTISRTLKSVALVVLLRRRVPVLPPETALPFMLRTTLVAVITALAAYAACSGVAELVSWSWDRLPLLIRLAAAGLVAAPVFWFSAQWLKLEEPAEMLSWGLAKVRGRS